MFVGLSGEPPDDPELEFYDPFTCRIDNLKRVLGDRYHSEHAPYLSMSLRDPTQAADGSCGGPGRFQAGHGIPHPIFSHGITVLTYDQRGTRISASNWRYTGPEEKAEDVIAALKSLNGMR